MKKLPNFRTIQQQVATLIGLLHQSVLLDALVTEIAELDPKTVSTSQGFFLYRFRTLSYENMFEKTKHKMAAEQFDSTYITLVDSLASLHSKILELLALMNKHPQTAQRVAKKLRHAAKSSLGQIKKLNHNIHLLYCEVERMAIAGTRPVLPLNAELQALVDATQADTPFTLPEKIKGSFTYECSTPYSEEDPDYLIYPILKITCDPVYFTKAMDFSLRATLAFTMNKARKTEVLANLLTHYDWEWQKINENPNPNYQAYDGETIEAVCRSQLALLNNEESLNKLTQHVQVPVPALQTFLSKFSDNSNAETRRYNHFIRRELASVFFFVLESIDRSSSPKSLDDKLYRELEIRFNRCYLSGTGTHCSERYCRNRDEQLKEERAHYLASVASSSSSSCAANRMYFEYDNDDMEAAIAASLASAEQEERSRMSSSVSSSSSASFSAGFSSSSSVNSNSGFSSSSSTNSSSDFSSSSRTNSSSDFSSSSRANSSSDFSSSSSANSSASFSSSSSSSSSAVSQAESSPSTVRIYQLITTENQAASSLIAQGNSMSVDHIEERRVSAPAIAATSGAVQPISQTSANDSVGEPELAKLESTAANRTFGRNP